MLIFAIDTTGFSASVALVKDGKEIFFNKISSGFIPDKGWQEFSYVLPSHHLNFIMSASEENLKKFNFSWVNVDAIAVSAYSGIYNCILVGLSVAETLAYCYKKNLIKVDHILAHMYSTWLERNPEDFKFPILIFSSSGSHSNFSLLENLGNCEIIYDSIPKQNKGEVEIFIGIGKIFREIGRRLKIITSADSGVEKLIEIASRGNPNKFDFTKYYQGPLLDLNFSNFMESISLFLKEEEKKSPQVFDHLINDVAASFQESITEILADKILKLAEIKKAKEIHIAGGISKNEYLKEKLESKIEKEKSSPILRYPVKDEYSLDNAAMISALGYYQQKYSIKFINFKPRITK